MIILIGFRSACEVLDAKTRSSTQILQNTDAGRALATLKESERHKLAYLFRNAHAVIKNNRPLSDYKWLCSMDKMKGLDIGDTYLNDKAAFNFIINSRS